LTADGHGGIQQWWWWYNMTAVVLFGSRVVVVLFGSRVGVLMVVVSFGSGEFYPPVN
jgi:hypothetical protein